MTTLSVRVASRRDEALGIVSFELVSADGAPLPPFSAGSHIDVKLSAGVVRQYSLYNDPFEAICYQIAVLKEANGRGGSKMMHEQIQVGDVIEISAPRNHFSLAHEAQSNLLLAGGVGITPILSMSERLAATGREFKLHYCARTPERAAFLERLAESRFASHVEFHFDNGVETQKFDIRSLLLRQPTQTHLYVCGPRGFMDAVLSTARDLGWKQAELHFEFFGAEIVPTRHGLQSFEVLIASSGKRVLVPADKSVAKALADAGITVPTSCDQGVCGTCLTRVLKGEPEHLDLYLTPEEQSKNDKFLPCCSRSKSACLELDL